MSLNVQTNISTPQNQINFKGVYILKGIYKDVKKAKDIIYSECGNDINTWQNKGKKFFPNFKECATLNLTAVYDYMQKKSQCLIATNEHYPNVINWNKKYLPSQRTPLMKCPYAHQPVNWRELIRITEEKFAEIQQKMAPYKHAEECEKRGNNDPMCDVLIDSYLQAKERLQQFKETATVPMSEIKELDVKEVLKAIKERRFNYITGEIK